MPKQVAKIYPAANTAFRRPKKQKRRHLIVRERIAIDDMTQKPAPQKRALLIVDVQKGFINDDTRHIPALVERLQYRYDYVFATRFRNTEDSPFRTLVEWDGMTAPEDIVLAFQLKEDAVVLDKTVYTCVTEEFLSMLDAEGIEIVDICGIDTDICVTKCAVDLFENGFVPVVLKDFCATTGGRHLQVPALEILGRYIGKKQIR